MRWGLFQKNNTIWRKKNFDWGQDCNYVLPSNRIDLKLVALDLH